MPFSTRARKIEQRLTRTVNAAMGELVGRGDPAPLEIVHGVVDRAEQQIQDLGRGRRVFPFNRIRVHVVSSPRDKEGRARIASVIEGPPSLSERVRDRLTSAGCKVTHVDTEVVFVRQPGQGWANPAWDLEFERDETVAAPPSIPAQPAKSGVVPIKIAVMKGSAEQHGYIFTGGRIDIGRRAEVLDQRHRLIRTNHVAFAEEGPEANGTVSRRHAHIEFSPDAQCYRLWDDRSAHGTSIVRNGRTIKIAAGPRGTRLEPGDEIVLGQARLRVSFGEPIVEPFVEPGS